MQNNIMHVFDANKRSSHCILWYMHARSCKHCDDMHAFMLASRFTMLGLCNVFSAYRYPKKQKNQVVFSK